MNDEQAFVFLIPDVEGVPVRSAEAEAIASPERDVAIPRFLKRAAKEVSISRQQLEDFWKQNVVGLTDTLADAQAARATKGFTVDEISFSIGVGARGGVFFVAEGSVEASMSIKLRRAG